MQIKITGKNLDIGEALTNHVEARLQQIAEKYFEGTVHAHVTVGEAARRFVSRLHFASGDRPRAAGAWHRGRCVPKFRCGRPISKSS